MEVKINVKIDIANFNQIIEVLSKLAEQTERTQILISNENMKSESIYTVEHKADIDIKSNIDIVKLRTKIGELSMSGKASQVKELLEKYNVKKLVDLEPKHYESLYKDITKK